MMKNRILKHNLCLMALTMLCLLFQNTEKVYAENEKHYPEPERYEMDAEESYSIRRNRRVDVFCYKKGRLGTLVVQGDMSQVSKDGANDSVTFEYIYKGQYHSGNKDTWNIYSENQKNILGQNLAENNQTGTIIIQKSVDNINWQTASMRVNAFSESNDGNSIVYTVPEEELVQGTYYRIYVTYAMKMRTKNRTLWDDYDSRRFVEVYEFFVCSENGGTLVEKSTYSKPVAAKIYECEKEAGFEGGKKVNGSTSFGIESYTTVKISQDADAAIVQSKHNGFDSYGVYGNTVRFFMELNYDLDLIDNEWKVVDSSWGEEEDETVCGVKTGRIGTGAFIIQKSETGKDEDWITVDDGKYASGLYTTGYGNLSQTEYMIYTPSGEDLANGVYIRIIYAYQVKKGWFNSVYCKEQYEFYVCNSELDAVTFRNLSLKDNAEELYGDMDEITVAIYKHAETLPSGSGTVTGFELNKELNQSGQCTVKRNGRLVEIPEDGKFLLDGRYDIHLENGFGDEREITLYVDKSSTEEALKNYFGEGFIVGKRIFAEDGYPVYEGGLTYYQLASVSEEYLPISGVIKNIDTGEEIVLESSRDARMGEIISAGTYVATFQTGTGTQETSTGDFRVFTFNFRVIGQGTAPGPVVNKRSLQEYAKTNISDVYPIYYGVTYQSASKGYITLAFQNREAATAYANFYESGMVEPQADGSYRYNGSLSVKQKETYISEWDLADATYFFAEQAVHRAYFDMSVPFTYTTLSEEVLDNTVNLRTLELNQSVIIFADEQRELLLTGDVLPCISEKKYSYIEPGLEGENITGWNDFEFVKDEEGYDSYSIQITDCNGKEYDIAYNKGVGEQLKQANCPSGIVTITEYTVYGDCVSYDAVYVREGDNFAEVSLMYYDQNQENRIVLKEDNVDTGIEVDAFCIEQVVDKLEPYSLVTILKDGEEIAFYCSDQLQKDTWSEKGNYTVYIKNRLGYGFSFDVVVRESNFCTISFLGEGTEKIENIITTTGAKGVILPELYRYGYDLEGFFTEDGMHYKNVIDQIDFVKNTELTAKWKPKQVEIILQDCEGNILEKKVAEYDTVIELEIPQLEENYEFIEWQRNGETLYNNILKVDTEEPILVQCFAKYIELENEEIDSEKQKEVLIDNETSRSNKDAVTGSDAGENSDTEETEKGISGFWKVLRVIGKILLIILGIILLIIGIILIICEVISVGIVFGIIGIILVIVGMTI